MELAALIATILISVTSATSIISYRLSRLENEIRNLSVRIDTLERRIDARLDRIEERLIRIERRIDASPIRV